jgi:tetratricopeptide (TPR) repeat protein
MRGWAAVLLGLVLVASAPPAAQARWLKAESPLFVVYGDGDEAQLRTFTQHLELFDALLRKITGAQAAPSPTKMRVYLVSGPHELQQVLPSALPSVYGFYVATPQGVVAVASRNDTEQISGETIVFHEYVHHFVNQYFPGAYPIWYQEGFAEYCSTVIFKKDSIELGQASPARIVPLTEMRWMSMEDLIAPKEGNARQPEMFYPQSWLATHYLMRHPERQGQLMAYLRALEKGDDPKAAFPAAFGMSIDDFGKLLGAYLTKGMTYSVLKPLSTPAPAVTITAMPASAEKLLLDQARLVVGDVDGRQAAGVIAGIEADVAQFPDDPDALKTLALADALYGDPAKADTPLDRLLGAHPDDVDGLYLKGLRYLMAGRRTPAERTADAERARGYLGAALKLNAKDFRVLHLYGLTFGGDDAAPADITVNALMGAHQLAPQVPEIAVNAGLALMRSGHFDDAIDVLTPVAYSPHPSSRTALAQRLLAKAKAHAQPTAAGE